MDRGGLPLALGGSLAIRLGLLAGATHLSLEANLVLPGAEALLLAVLAAFGSLLVGVLTVVASTPDLGRQQPLDMAAKIPSATICPGFQRQPPMSGALVLRGVLGGNVRLAGGTLTA